MVAATSMSSPSMFSTISSSSSSMVSDAQPVIIHATSPSSASETTNKVSHLIECFICTYNREPDQMTVLEHKTTTTCSLHVNKEICVECLADIQSLSHSVCPICRENTETGERPSVPPPELRAEVNQPLQNRQVAQINDPILREAMRISREVNGRLDRVMQRVELTNECAAPQKLDSGIRN